jgi:predicted RNA-binding Zn-ribbon protein involved in translation (DUF1610 family)
MEKKDIVFICRKCEHMLYVENISVEKLKQVSEYDCPNCGEEGFENWILSRLGNYDYEMGKG